MVAYTTTFPAAVQEQIGAKWVLVVKKAMDFYLYEPQLDTVDEHVEWFHQFWWKDDGQTRPKLIGFFDTAEEACETGIEFAACAGDESWNWAVYDCDGILVDGAY